MGPPVGKHHRRHENRACKILLDNRVAWTRRLQAK
jgi:hypothetical protein